jgi:hypothetical protein
LVEIDPLEGSSKDELDAIERDIEVLASGLACGD